MQKRLDVVVVGGSLGGLMNAVTFKTLGHNVTILERSPIPLLHDQGAGVVAGRETLAWVSRFAKLTNNDISVQSNERLYLDLQGHVIDREASQQHMTSWSVLYNLARKAFVEPSAHDWQQSSETGEGNGRYEYGRVVDMIQGTGEKIDIHFQTRQKDEDASDQGTISADLLIAADGPSSTLRTMLLGKKVSQRTYAGYVAFRGTVPESQLSLAASDVFVERFTFFHGTRPNTQILAYTIPGRNGDLRKGHRHVNWVWYWNVPGDSKEYDDIFTDIGGKRHRFTLPSGGKMQTKVWDTQKQRARRGLPPQFAELVEKTGEPFVQAITDLPPPKSGHESVRSMDGKAIIVGDALAGFRPHTAASTSQAAFHALLLEKAFKHQISWDDYDEQVMNYARSLQAHGVRLGNRSQFGEHPLGQ